MLKQEPMTPDRVRLLPALSLAHLGDAVFELLVRAELCAGPAAKTAVCTGRPLRASAHRRRRPWPTASCRF